LNYVGDKRTEEEGPNCGCTKKKGGLRIGLHATSKLKEVQKGKLVSSIGRGKPARISGSWGICGKNSEGRLLVKEKKRVSTGQSVDGKSKKLPWKENGGARPLKRFIGKERKGKTEKSHIGQVNAKGILGWYGGGGKKLSKTISRFRKK